MINDSRTADEIERDIENERAEMSGTINELQKKFSVEGIVSDIGTMFRDQGGDLGRAISATVGRNPAAVALVGVGLAWLVLGQGRSRTYADQSASPTFGPYRDRGAAYGRNPERAATSYDGSRGTFEQGDRSWFDGHGLPDGHLVGRSNGASKSNGNKDHSSGITGSIRDGASAVADAVTGMAGSVRDTAVDLAEKLASGTEGLSIEAKERVMAARRAAHDARMAAADTLKRGGRAASNLFEDQPLVMGALAIAVGAGLGSLLPHSKIEDEALGANSDRLFADGWATMALPLN